MGGYGGSWQDKAAVDRTSCQMGDVGVSWPKLSPNAGALVRFRDVGGPSLAFPSGGSRARLRPRLWSASCPPSRHPILPTALDYGLRPIHPTDTLSCQLPPCPPNCARTVFFFLPLLKFLQTGPNLLKSDPLTNYAPFQNPGANCQGPYPANCRRTIGAVGAHSAPAKNTCQA